MNKSIICEATFPEDSGHTMLNFFDIIRIFTDQKAKLEEAEIPDNAFKEIMSAMPAPSIMCIDRANEKFGHYMYTTDRGKDEDGRMCVKLWMKEIASTDPSLCHKIKDKMLDVYNDFAAVFKLKNLVIGRNPSGEIVLKFVYETQHEKNNDQNSYDAETKLRTTWSNSYNESYIRQIASFLSGEFNVPILDELT